MIKTLLVAPLLLVLFTSCGFLQSLRKAQPDAQFVEASRETYEAIGPSYIGYLDADETTNPLLLDARRQALADWEFAIRKAEEALAPDEEPEGEVVE